MLTPEQATAIFLAITRMETANGSITPAFGAQIRYQKTAQSGDVYRYHVLVTPTDGVASGWVGNDWKWDHALRVARNALGDGGDTLMWEPSGVGIMIR